MRVLIVDDEAAARRRLALMLEELDVEVVGETSNGVEALDLAARLRPDVLLLDIQMREMSGLDVVRHLPDPRPLVIFQTAYDGYAVQAFEQEAVDYVLKPVSLKRLRSALERARSRLAAARPQLDNAAVGRLTSALEQSGRGARPRILVRDGEGHRLLALREVLLFRAADGDVMTCAVGGRYRTDFTLDEIEARAGGAFIRVSRSDLVNIEAIRRIVPAGDGAATLTLADGAQVRVSRRRAPDVRRAIEG
ncbi:MAG: LytTR family DNA-binding domain-containing protein [Gemmatimonadota bacterium]|nr:LytTR family DNA-binding domain-containing protein [Gemmatimonadota bacterium]